MKPPWRGAHASRKGAVITGRTIVPSDLGVSKPPVQRLKGTERTVVKAMGNSTVISNPHERMSAYLADRLAKVDALIQQRMASEHAPRIQDVAAHLIGSGGKRLRPILTLASSAMFGYDGRHDIHLAATVEMIHTATLLHDDVVDESQQRRGKPTANLLWDNQSSVLVGDYLFSRAFELMVETGDLRILETLARTSAIIAEGEVLQLTATVNIETTEETYLKIVRGKTAALFSAATKVGAMVAGQQETVIEAMSTYGDALGIAFQIADDILDFRGTDATGKNVGDDFRERKLTLPMIRAIAAGGPQDRPFWDRVIAGHGKQTPGDLGQALDRMEQYKVLEATQQTAQKWAEQAKAALSIVEPHPMKSALVDLADYVVERLS